MLIWGENLAAMRALPQQSIQLIYADPPFFSSRRYGRLYEKDGDPVFNDVWPDGLDGYLSWLRPRIVEMRNLLKESGSIYVHLDWHASHYVKVLMDRIFGYRNFLNEIIWHYSDPAGTVRDRFKKKHDTILLYAKRAGKHLFNLDAVRSSYSRGTIVQGERGVVSFGRPTKLNSLGKAPEDVWNIPIINSQARERSGYPTQKPVRLLQSIVKASSSTGDVVADFFCGSGTTPLVAQMLGRKWIASDVSHEAVATTLGRLQSYQAAGGEAVRPRLLTVGVTRPFSPEIDGKNRPMLTSLCYEALTGIAEQPHKISPACREGQIGESQRGGACVILQLPSASDGADVAFVAASLEAKDAEGRTSRCSWHIRSETVPSPFGSDREQKCLRLHMPPAVRIAVKRTGGASTLILHADGGGDGTLSSGVIEVGIEGEGGGRRSFPLSFSDLRDGHFELRIGSGDVQGARVSVVDSGGSSTEIHGHFSQRQHGIVSPP